MRTRFGDFPEYHTSLDKLGVTVTKNGLKGSYNYVTKIIDATESIAIKPKLKVKCEPNLGREVLPIDKSKGSCWKKQISCKYVKFFRLFRWKKKFTRNFRDYRYSSMGC